MATYQRKQYARRAWRLLSSSFLIFILSGCNQHSESPSGAFYQPLNQDKTLKQQDWLSIAKTMERYELNQVVVQWTQYGDETFGGPSGWLAQNLETLIDNDIQLWLGLYSDPNYFKRIHASVEQQQQYLTRYFEELEKSYQRWKPWIDQHQPKINGLYLPLELSDYDFVTQQQRDLITNVLAQQVKKYPMPLMVTLYLAANNDSDVISKWTKEIRQAGITLYIQDGAGTQSLSDEQRRDYLNSLSCETGLVREVFVQEQQSSQFVAKKMNKQAFLKLVTQQSCHSSILFSLRYFPDNNPLKLVK
ncbi:DUF4434 domain-containing protein [Vibrio sp. TRT 21S02]|uniref:DUF4434 domain-containing protein n=1 Tax=Vibrio sp. TRT 21S02 TaxID=3418507 RepID=UPI003CEAB453